MEPSPTLREALTDKGLKMYDNYVPPIPLRNKECDIFYACMLLEHLPTYNEAGFFMSELNGLSILLVLLALKDGTHVTDFIVARCLGRRRQGWRHRLILRWCWVWVSGVV